MRRVHLALLLALVVVSPRPSAARPRLSEEALTCRILEVKGPAGNPERLRVSCGKKHGVVTGTRAEVYAKEPDGGVHVVGRAEIADLGDLESWMNVLPEAAARPAEITDKGGLVTLRVLLPLDVHPGLLLGIYLDGIVFLDNDKRPIVTLEDLLAARDDSVEKKALAKMVRAGLEVLDFTNDLKAQVSHGRWKGKVCRQVLEGSTPDDYRDFLRFVRDYPGKYMGREWKISETYATWIINDEPLSMEDLDKELTALGLTPALDARAAALDDKDTILLFERLRGELTAMEEAQRDAGAKRLALLERIYAARAKKPTLVQAEMEQARARYLVLDPTKKLEAAAAYGRAAALYAQVPIVEERGAPLERIVCLNNQATYLHDAGKPDEALKLIAELRASIPQVATIVDAEIAAHLQLSEAYAIGQAASIANERGDYARVVAEITPLLDRYAAVGAPGSRAKEIQLIRFLATAHGKLGEIDTAAKLLERATKRADELGDLQLQAQIAWSIGELHYGASRYPEAAADYDRMARLATAADDKPLLAKGLAAAGQSFWAMGKPAEAIERHAEAMKLRETIGEESGIAWELTQVGKIRVELGDRDAARRDFERALGIFAKVDAKSDEADAHRELGRLFLAISQPADAERELGAARGLYRTLKKAPDEAWTTLDLAKTRAVARDWKGAVAFGGEAAAIGDRTGDVSLRVAARRLCGGWLRQDGRRKEARAALDQALAVVGDDPGLRGDVLVDRSSQARADGELAAAEADTSAALALAEKGKDAGRRLNAFSAHAQLVGAKGEYEASIKLYEQMAALARQAGNRPALVDALQQKAWQLASIGRLADAQVAVDEALALSEKNGDAVERAWTFNVLAEIAGYRNDMREELRLYDEALVLMKGARFDYGQAVIVFNRANVSVRLRDFDEGLRGIEEALRLAGHNSTADFDVAAATLRGQVLGQLGRHDEADAALAAAGAQAATAIPERVPGILSSRGRLLAQRGDFDKALPLLEEAVKLTDARAHDRSDDLAELGIARARAGRPEAAATLREAIARAERAGGALPWEALYQLGRLQAAGGDTTAALLTLGRAAKEIEKGEVVLSTDAARSRYWGDKVEVYTLLVKLLLAQNRVADALRYVERAKAAELEDLRRQSGGREGDLALELEIAESRFVAELRSEQGRARPDADKLRRLDELLVAVRGKRADYIEQLDRKLGGGGDVFAIRPLELEKLQEFVPKGMLVLSPVALDDKLVVFAVTHDAITHFDVAVSSAELDKLVGLVLEEVAPPGGVRRGAVPLEPLPERVASPARLLASSQKLYDLLLRPALERFGVPKILVVSASGGLRYLPWTALHDGKQWLVERTALVEVTALDQGKFAAPPPPKGGGRVLAFADPDGTLPGARTEVADVKSVFGTVSVLQGEGATLQALRAGIDVPGYEIVHLATHGRLDAAHPEQSNILLAGAPLFYKDIPALRFSRTQLVVLSACDTASRGSGVEVTGLAYQFERTKVRAVIATLWPVDDAATAKLMADFYKRLKKGATYAEALAGAQRALAGEAKFANPYYWAPFVLIGAP